MFLQTEGVRYSPALRPGKITDHSFLRNTKHSDIKPILNKNSARNSGKSERRKQIKDDAAPYSWQHCARQIPFRETKEDRVKQRTMV